MAAATSLHGENPWRDHPTSNLNGERVSVFSADWQVEPLSPIAEASAATFLSERFGVTGTLERLGSNHDCNFRVRSDPAQDGARDYVLKFFNPVTDSAALLAHCAAIERLAVAMPDVRLPRGRSGLDGQFLQTFRHDDADLDSLLLDFVPGEPIMDSRYLAPRVVARLGELAGRVTSALEGFEKPPAARPSMWDLRHAYDVVESLAPQMPDPAAGQQVLEAAETGARAWSSRTTDSCPSASDPRRSRGQQPRLRGRRRRSTAPGGDHRLRRPHGQLDGLRSWRSPAPRSCTTTAPPPHRSCPAVEAFNDVRPLADEELEVLWPLVVLRAAVLVVAGQNVVLKDAQNAYASAALDREWRMFEVSTSVPAEVMTAQLRSALGRAHTGRPLPAAGVPLMPGLPEDVTVLDLSVTSDDLHSGSWQDDAAEATLVAEALALGRPGRADPPRRASTHPHPGRRTRRQGSHARARRRGAPLRDRWPCRLPGRAR